MLEQEGSADINYFMTHNAALCGVPNLTYWIRLRNSGDKNI